MNFAQQRDPRRHMVGITTAVFLHAIVIYALTNGLARKVVDVLKKPLDVSIIEEVKKQPPPPKVALPPPKVVEPPPAFVPPPEVQVQPPPVQPVIAVTAPVPPPPPPPAPVVAAPRIVNVGAVCPGYQAVLAKGLAPAQARGLSGKVLVEFIVSASGTVGGVTIVKSSNPALNAIASAAVGQLNCVAQGQSARVQVPLVFEQER